MTPAAMARRDKWLRQLRDLRIQNECLIARQLLSENPSMSRSDALREANRILLRTEW